MSATTWLSNSTPQGIASASTEFEKVAFRPAPTLHIPPGPVGLIAPFLQIVLGEDCSQIAPCGIEASTIWNAGGYPSSSSYLKGGNWLA